MVSKGTLARAAVKSLVATGLSALPFLSAPRCWASEEVAANGVQLEAQIPQS